LILKINEKNINLKTLTKKILFIKLNGAIIFTERFLGGSKKHEESIYNLVRVSFRRVNGGLSKL
jgi:hypothetical protein